MPRSTNKFNIVVGLVLIICVIVALYIFSSKTSDTLTYYIILVIAALASALITNFLSGNIRYKGKDIRATGSKAIFIIVITLGITFQQINVRSLFFTVILRNSTGESVLKNEGKLELILGDNPVVSPIDNNGQATFKGIPSSMRNKAVITQLLETNLFR